MAVTLEDTVILFISGAVFIPIFIFLIKMIMKVSELESRISSFVNGQKEVREHGVSISDIKSDMRVLKLRMDNAEIEIRGSGSGSPRIDYDGIRDLYKERNKEQEDDNNKR